jgi:hypothetical protein
MRKWIGPDQIVPKDQLRKDEIEIDYADRTMAAALPSLA